MNRVVREGGDFSCHPEVEENLPDLPVGFHNPRIMPNSLSGQTDPYLCYHTQEAKVILFLCSSWCLHTVDAQKCTLEIIMDHPPPHHFLVAKGKK